MKKFSPSTSSETTLTPTPSTINHKPLTLFILFLCPLILVASPKFVEGTEVEGKQIYIPEELRSINFNDTASQWCYQRMALTPNFVIFWEKGFGDDLSNPPALEGHDMHVDLELLKAKLESFYAFYRDSLHFIETGSNAEKYRMMVMLNYFLDGTAYGGDYDEFIGAFWVAPNRIHDRQLNCVAHELGHSFQMQVHADKRAAAGKDIERWFGGGFFEMTSQWMLWHVNPNWIRDELYHWEAYRKTPHKACMHWENVYHSPYPLEWWSQNYGLTVISDIYKQGRHGEGPIETLMRLKGMDAPTFYNDLFEACRHTVFLDFKHAFKETRPYAGGFQTQLIDEEDGWKRICPQQCPEDGGFNAIEVSLPKPGKKVSIQFEGLKSFSTWRYGFVALTADGTCLYSDAYTYDGLRKIDKAVFQAPRHTTLKSLYLVVMGAPNSRNNHSEEELTFPYRIKF